MAGAGAGAGQGFPGVEDPEAAARIQQLRRIKELESLLELERGLREGAEKLVAAFKKRLERMQQEQGVEGVPPAVPANVPEHASPPGPAGAGAGSEQDPPAVEEAEPLVPGDPDWRDWAGLPEDLLVKVAEKFVALHDATYEGFMRGHVDPNGDLSDEEYEETIQEGLENRKGKSPSRGLFIFAMVCKAWRAAQLKVGGTLCTLVLSDVFLADWEPGTYCLPGYTAPREIVKWALKNGCPRKNTGRVDGYILRGGSPHLACIAMELGDLQMVKWLCTKQGCPVDGDLRVSAHAARHGPCMLWDLKEGRIMEYVCGDIDFEELLILSKEDFEGLL